MPVAQPARVLLAYRDDVDVAGGAAAVMRRTAEALSAQGVTTEITFHPRPDTAGFDLVHAVNAWSPRSALEQLRHLAAQDAPVVWQPFFLGWSELAWAARALPQVLDLRQDPADRARLLEAFAAGTLTIDGLSQHAPNEIEPGAHAAWREMVALSDHIVVASWHEARLLSRTVGLQGTPFTRTPHGVDAEAFAGAGADAFRRHLGDDHPFVLCVGAVDRRKNQLMLAEAVRGTDLRAVLVGPAFEPDVLAQVLELGDGQVRHLDRLPRELIASALHAAAAHVLPSWSEAAALVNLEAAAAGCPLVLSDRSSELEYFGSLGIYCDPADPTSIREAIQAAVRVRDERPERGPALQALARELTWERTATATLEAYAATLAEPRRRDVPTASPPRPQLSAALRRFTDALPWTRQPILAAVRRAAEDVPAGARVLDVGAGEAPYRELFEHTTYLTTDWEHSVHPGARDADIIGSADDLPVDDGSFDLVLLTEVLEHVADADAVLRELHRVLVPGGRLVLTVPFVWPLHELPHDVWRPTSWGLHDALVRAGFTAVGVDARNDAYTTVAQLLADLAVIVRPFPDGRDTERAAVAAEGRAFATQLARHAPLDVHGDLPLGWAATAHRPPATPRPRGPRHPGARRFVTLADVRDVLARPALLAAYARCFGHEDDATLLLHAPPGTDRPALEHALTRAIAQAGPGADAPDLLLADAGHALTDLVAGADAVLGDRPPTWALAGLPHAHGGDVARLRALADEAPTA